MCGVCVRTHHDTVTQRVGQDTGYTAYPWAFYTMHSMRYTVHTLYRCSVLYTTYIAHRPKTMTPTHAITGSITVKASKHENTHRERGSETITSFRHENQERIRRRRNVNWKGSDREPRSTEDSRLQIANPYILMYIAIPIF